MIRIVTTEDAIFLPPDLSSTELKFDLPEINKGERRIILDFDHTATGRLSIGGTFVPHSIIEEMWELHATTEQAFRSIVTEEAINFWKTK